MNLLELKTDIASCRECSLRKRCRQVSLPAGRDSARIMVLGEAPDMEDGIHGATMIDVKGEFLVTHLEKLFARTDFYLTNTVKCFPGSMGKYKGTVPPPLYAIEACSPFLESEIAFVEPEVIVAVGAKVMKRFKIKGGVRQNTGKVFWNDDYGIPVIVIPAPGSLMGKKTRPADVLAFTTALNAIKTLLDGGHDEPEYSDTLSLDDSLIGYDVETSDDKGFPVLRPSEGDIWCSGFASRTDRIARMNNMEAASILKYITPVMWHKKFDARWSKEKLGVDVGEDFEDPMLMAHILGLRPLGLKDLASIFIGGNPQKFRDVVKKGVSFDDIPEDVMKYCAGDAWKALKMLDILKPMIEAGGWEHVYEFDKKFSGVLGRMEDRGMPVSYPKMTRWKDELLVEMQSDLEILEQFGITTPSKPASYSGMFWKGSCKDHKGTHRISTEKGGLSTSADDLTDHASEDQKPWVEALIRWRQNSKFIATYLDNWIDLALHDGKLHPSFNQTATATGRPSTSDPNLGNVTKSNLFQMFEAPEGYQFISCDYSQVELRMLANVSGDRTLIEAYHNGMDMHDLTSAMRQVQRAARIAYNLTSQSEPFDDYLRTFSKRVNFGIVYGITAWGLGKMLKIDGDQAQAIIDAFYEKFPGVGDWQARNHTFAKANLYVEDWFGRPLWVPGAAVDRGSIAHRAEKQEKNYPIQGGAAQVTKEQMMETQEYQVNWVYDEVLYLVPDAHVKDYSEFLSEALVGRQHELPYTIDMKVGRTWGDIKHIPEYNPEEFAV